MNHQTELAHTRELLLEWPMREPHLTEFKRLIREGAGTLDIHDVDADTALTRPTTANDALVAREVERAETHRRKLVPLLREYVDRVDRVLDVGCSTGGTSVAVALELGAREVIGLDPNQHSLQAARERARGYGLSEERCSFRTIEPNSPLPFASDEFDLTLCVSVLEYIHRPEDRFALARELERVTRPGGHVLVATPNPLRIRELHTGRLLGDWRRDAGYPWSSPPWQLAAMLRTCDVRWLGHTQLRQALRDRGLDARILPEWTAPLGHMVRWQRLLGRKRAS